MEPVSAAVKCDFDIRRIGAPIIYEHYSEHPIVTNCGPICYENGALEVVKNYYGSGYEFIRIQPYNNFPHETKRAECIYRRSDGHERRVRTIHSFTVSGCSAGEVLDSQSGQCVPINRDDKIRGCTSAGVGNPCNAATGNKYQTDTDIKLPGIRLTRHYNSLDSQDYTFGVGWSATFFKRIERDGNSLVVRVADGSGEPWVLTSTGWQGDADSDIELNDTGSGYTVTRADGHTESYDYLGRLIDETTASGRITTYQYGVNGRLAAVTNHFGQTLTITEDANGHIDTITDSSNQVYRYAYDVNDNLVSVTYPDETPGNDTDNPTRTYHYEDANFPHHLTGITDENGDRYATFAYDSTGKATSTEHAVTDNVSPQEKFTLDYQ